jgi:hypothetical protein
LLAEYLQRPPEPHAGGPPNVTEAPEAARETAGSDPDGEAPDRIQ